MSRPTTSMLKSSSFRRTAQDSKFTDMLKSKLVPLFPVKKISAEDIRPLIARSGLEQPLLLDVEESARMGGLLPDPNTTLQDVTEVIGPDTPIKIIEVESQAEITDRTLSEFADYLHHRTESHKTLNMISLEVSATPLSTRVQAPLVVRELDWIDFMWPLERRARGDFPQVQKYCLSGMKDSYTDFHLDFGGTSVWYRVLWGQKRFYFIPPSAANLRAFIEWSTSKDQEDIFLGDLVMPGQCFYIDLMPGQTLFIPSAWIHAVYTPKDSLVFGGNFLHSTSILRQLQVYKVEMITKVKAVNRFPYFRQIHFYVLCSLLPPMRKKVDKPFGTTNENDDTDEDDEDLVAFSAAASSPLVFRQLPFLLNACQIWLDTSDVEEKDIFRKATSQLRLSPNEFLQEWWRLLKIIATNLDNGSVEKKEQTYIERFLSNPASELDVLDDAVISGALPEANNEPWALAAAAIAADAEANPKFPGVGRKVASTHIVTAREKQVLDTKNPLASSLSHLPNTTSNPPKNYSSVGDMGQPPPQSHVEIASGIEIKTLPIKDKEKHLDQDLNDVQSLSHDTLHAQTSSSMPPVKQRNSTEGYARGSLNSEREATQNLSNNVRIPLPESECEAKGTPIHPLPTLKLTLKAERSGETEPSNSVCPTLKLHLRNLPHTTSKRRRGANESSTTKQSKRRNIESVHDDSDDEDENESDEDSEVEDSEGETHISKTYVTRGKKLSSNYLERATDVAIGSGLCGGEWDDDDDDDEDGAYHEGDSIPGDSCDEAEDYDSDNDGPRHAKRTKEPKPKPASRPKAAPQPKKPRETSRQHLIKKLMKKR